MTHDIEQRLKEWHNRKYGPDVNIPATYKKLLEEVGELGEALMAGSSIDIDEEAADVAIVLIHLLRGSAGMSLAGAILRKLPVIEERLEMMEQGQS